MKPIPLLNGCYRSEISVFPKNWEAKNAPLQKKNPRTGKMEELEWRVYYRFYDPLYKNTKKWGQQAANRKMNKHDELSKRQDATRKIIAFLTDRLDNKGWNPITKKYMSPDDNPEEEGAKKLSAMTPLKDALRTALAEKKMDDDTKVEMRSVLKYFLAAAAIEGKDTSPLTDIKRSDIVTILKVVPTIPVVTVKHGKEHIRPKVWNDRQYNRYLDYLSMLYGWLENEGILEYNPITKIERVETIKDPHKKRKVLSDEERLLVYKHLKKRFPRFLRFMLIFYHSGGRIKELLSIRGKDVDLEKQGFWVLVNKRKKKEYVFKTIKDKALPLWKEVMNDGMDEAGNPRPCLPDEYVFSDDLRPRLKDKPILRSQISRRWNNVKEQTGIQADFYALKHMHTTDAHDELEEKLKERKELLKKLADHASHTSDRMIREHYDIGNDIREHLSVKTLKNDFLIKTG